MKNTNTETKTTKTTTKAPTNKKESTAKKAVDSHPKTEPMNPPSVFDDKAFCNDIKKRCDSIVRELVKASDSYIKIGVELCYIRDKKGYEVMGAKSIGELAQKRFGIKKSTASEWMSVAEAFCKRDDNGNLIAELQDAYKKFTSSKLTVMLGMTEDVLLEVTADMSVRDIKKLKKGEDSEETAETGEDVEIEVKEIPVPQRQVMITVGSLEEYNVNEDKIYGMIERALKVKKSDTPKYKVEISMVW